MNWTWIVILFGVLSVIALFVVWLDINHPADGHNEPPSRLDQMDAFDNLADEDGRQ